VDFNFSVFSRPWGDGEQGPNLVAQLHNALRAMDAQDRWEVTTGDFWCCVTPTHRVTRFQGWKLHISATVVSAETVLARVLPILLRGDSSFKFAATIQRVAQLNDRHTPRGHAGKFLTIYPKSDEAAVRLAHQLHEATTGLPGPLILSDRPYCPGSLVHYRYGAFVEERRVTNDGMYRWVIFDPDGNPVEDQRGGTFRPPPWAECPFPSPPESSGGKPETTDAGLLLGGRFAVKVAIRHANKGGVYRGVDTQDGTEVVIKEARPYVDVDGDGNDVRDALRGEAHVLQKLHDLPVAPRLRKLFEQGQHVFLAEDLVPGISLRHWVTNGIRDGHWRLPVPNALEMAIRVVELMAKTHQAGVIVRDFNPANIMVRPDGELRLIDLELAVVSGEPGRVMLAAGTPGFSAPEQLRGALPAVEADYYALGATLCFVLTGAIPVLLDEQPTARPIRQRLADWLDVRAQTVNLPDGLRALLLQLMADDPARRCTLAQARTALAAAHQRNRGAARCRGWAPRGARLDEQQWQHAVDGCLGHLLTTIDPKHDTELWPATCYHAALDQCAVQVGAAGVLGVLTRAFQLTGDPRLPDVISTAGHWIAGQLDRGTDRFTSLYFGEAGIAWALYDAGSAVADAQLVERALALAETLPVSAENPDLTHGTAGLGLTFLHFWLRTGHEQFADRAAKAADELAATAITESAGVSWSAPTGFDSRFAGGRFLGFSHGLAGVGYFLLAMGLATGRSDCLELAERTGKTLLSQVHLIQDAAMWAASPGAEITAPYWCHGSSGIGSFLIRLHAATGDDHYREMAERSALAVMMNSWRGVLGQCHGLAGNGDFLLDMAQATGAEKYLDMAHHLARVIFASRAYRNDLAVFPDEQGELSASWAHGVAGILAFLLRLRYQGPRLWMVDQPPRQGSRQ
jgi:tRNA A-37 threonylcarbamoyl transferase component Bud32